MSDAVPLLAMHAILDVCEGRPIRFRCHSAEQLEAVMAQVKVECGIPAMQMQVRLALSRLLTDGGRNE